MLVSERDKICTIKLTPRLKVVLLLLQTSMNSSCFFPVHLMLMFTSHA